MGRRKSKEVGLLYDVKRDGELSTAEVVLIGKDGTHTKMVRRNKKTAGETTRSEKPQNQ